MTYRQLLLAAKPISKLAVQDLPLTIAYRLDKLIKAIEDESPFFYARRKEIALKYGKPSQSDPSIYSLSDETVSDATKELDELNDMEVSICLPEITIPITDSLKLSVQDIQKLNGIIEFTESEESSHEN